MANRPPITAAIDLTSDLLNALKKAGPNDRGNYSLDMAVWPNEKRSSDRAPGFTGSVKVKGDMTMHGVTKSVEVPGQIVVTAAGVTLKANFDILCSDYSINIPRNNASAVSNKVAISVNCALTPRA